MVGGSETEKQAIRSSPSTTMFEGQVCEPAIFIAALREYYEANADQRGPMANTLSDAIISKRVDLAEVRRGLLDTGENELMDALDRSWRNTAEVASVGVVVEALDDTARAFYLHHEFRQLQDHPHRLFLALAAIEKAFKAG